MSRLTYWSLKISTWTIFNLFTIIVMLCCYIWVQPAKVTHVQVIREKNEWVMNESELKRFIPKQKNPLIIVRGKI